MNLKTKPINISVIIASFYIFFNTTVLAGGLYINEFGTPSMGVAGAGANAVASDASTSFHNAAGMTLINGTELMGSIGALIAPFILCPGGIANLTVYGHIRCAIF